MNGDQDSDDSRNRRDGFVILKILETFFQFKGKTKAKRDFCVFCIEVLLRNETPIRKQSTTGLSDE